MEPEIIFEIIDDETQGVDTYHNNGSMWLIFTDEKKWVIELTKEGTLWYNYYFFRDCFKYVSLDVVENQHYITEWVENTIQNGLRFTVPLQGNCTFKVERIIQNGVKSTCYTKMVLPSRVKNTIQNGIKKTEYVTHNLDVEKALKNGIKETNHCSVSNDENARMTLQNGIKVTKGLGPSEVIEKEINKVIKEVKELPDKSGELMGYGEYYARQKNRTYPHTDIVNDVINDGIKETKYCELHSLMRADHIIRDGIKETKSIHIHNGEPIDSVIQNGIKETNWRKVDNFPDYVDRIIK